MMKYTFAAALFAAAIYATEIVDPQTEDTGDEEHIVVVLEDVPEPVEEEQAEPAKTESSPPE